RGARTVEVLKQDLNKPLPVEKQVAILYALTKGYLDDIPVADIRRFEEEYYMYLDQNHKELLNGISQTGNLPADEEFSAAIEGFKRTFAPSN
ncbi:F0F1 ATP synthase subunit alpha, partial [Bacillus atrophaeus]|nr:F0F1 ATP synthase subunit alpha [Bacillus atrophaeus]